MGIRIIDGEERPGDLLSAAIGANDHARNTVLGLLYQPLAASWKRAGLYGAVVLARWICSSSQAR